MPFDRFERLLRPGRGTVRGMTSLPWPGLSPESQESAMTLKPALTRGHIEHTRIECARISDHSRDVPEISKRFTREIHK